jgi:hypothetical protein
MLGCRDLMGVCEDLQWKPEGFKSKCDGICVGYGVDWT